MGILDSSLDGGAVTRNRRAVWAALLLGALCGASGTQALTSRARLDAVNRSQQWEVQAGRWHQETERLKQQLGTINRQSTRDTYIQSVRLKLLSTPISPVDVEAALAPYTETLLGIALSQVHLDMVYRMLNGRHITVGGALYRVEVIALLVSPDTRILLRVVPETRSHAV